MRLLGAEMKAAWLVGVISLEKAVIGGTPSPLQPTLAQWAGQVNTRGGFGDSNYRPPNAHRYEGRMSLKWVTRLVPEEQERYQDKHRDEHSR